MTLQEQIDALPEWPTAADPISDGMFYRRMSAAYSQRLALAREWIANGAHTVNCDVTLGEYPQYEMCNCGAADVLKALEGP